MAWSIQPQKKGENTLRVNAVSAGPPLTSKAGDHSSNTFNMFHRVKEDN